MAAKGLLPINLSRSVNFGMPVSLQTEASVLPPDLMLRRASSSASWVYCFFVLPILHNVVLKQRKRFISEKSN